MGLVISTFGNVLKKGLPECLPILADRKGNELTRLTAVKVVFRANPLVLCYLADYCLVFRLQSITNIKTLRPCFYLHATVKLKI